MMENTLFPKKILIILLIIIFCVVTAYFMFWQSPAGETETPEADEGGSSAPAETPISVNVDEARIGDLVIKLRSPGEAFTRRNIMLSAEVPGVIKNLVVDEGRHVRQGDLLLELDNREYGLDLESARAQYLQALSELLLEEQFSMESESVIQPETSQKWEQLEKELKEAQDLYAKGMIARQEVEDKRQAYELALIESGGKKEEIREAAKGVTQAYVNVQKAELDLEKTQIRSPFSGIIHNIKVSPRERINSGQELFNLVNIHEIEVHAKVLESEVGRMEEGRDADVKFSAYPDTIFKGKVKAISPVVNPEDKTCTVIIHVANRDEKIKPGMHAQVEIPVEIHRNRLLIPQDAVLVRQGRKLAFVMEGELAKWRYIEAGLENDQFVEVLEGVQAGEKVIVEGHFTLAHDAKVRVVE
jgi:RND family efflux transporter MFP subunit